MPWITVNAPASTTQTARLPNCWTLKMLLVIQPHLFSRSMRCCELSDDIAIWNSLFLQVPSKRPLSLPAVSCLLGLEGKTESLTVQLKHLPFCLQLPTCHKNYMTAAVIYLLLHRSLIMLPPIFSNPSPQSET